MSEPKGKILIADDEPNIRLLTMVMLKDIGYEIIQAENGAIAIEKARTEKPDLIITDVMMPEKDGFEVCRAVRSIPEIAQTPIIILSALGDEYNKITGFEGGADDYITKPFNIEELKARVSVLLTRSKGRNPEPPAPAIQPPTPQSDAFSAVPVAPAEVAAPKKSAIVDQVPSGSATLDRVLGGGLPQGGNLLLIGPMGIGKSTFARQFMTTGLKNSEKCLWVALDDHPTMIRKVISNCVGQDCSVFENAKRLCLVDSYTWSAGGHEEGEKFVVTGVLELTQLAGVVADASSELGQTIQKKAGGRRVIDSISSLLVNFELGNVQRFITQIARTAIAFGGVTTLFLMEEGTVSDQVLNNIKYLMDGVIEFKEENGESKTRVLNMKWLTYSKEWVRW